MTNKEKQLLLQDLCARLPYGLKGKVKTTDGNGREIKDEGVINSVFINEHGKAYICIEGIEYELEDVKPYLRPMSSMMQGEWEEMTGLIYPYGRVNRNLDNDGLSLWLSAEENDMPIILMDNVFAWLNKKMFDYHGLIPMGLALPAPKRMYKR